MMADDFNERLDSLEDISRRLAGMLVAQHEMNQDVKGFMQQQVEINANVSTTLARVEITLARVETTLARIETLVARVLRSEDNGRDA